VATAGSATTAGTVTTAAQPNITSVGNLVIANIDNIQIDGNSISTTNTNGNLEVNTNGTGYINLNDNIQVAGTVLATSYTSNVATGTAPFVVTSTTQVANLNVATAGTASTVTTAAQPNITSTGTLTSLTTSGVVSIAYDGTADTGTTNNAVMLEIKDTGATAQPSMAFHRPLAYATKVVLDTDNKLYFGGWSAAVGGQAIVCGNITPGANITYGLGTSSLRWTTIYGTSTSAQYADLAERYLADADYPVGTVLKIGGDAEITIAEKGNVGVVGTVSENPGFLMNDTLEGDHLTSVAYIGRVPCRVNGHIKRGDLLVVGETPGVATAVDPRDLIPGTLVGKALQAYNNSKEGTIEILVGRQ
jgi:hypothetical protein